MPEPASLVSAGAASLAAVLAGLNLYLSGRRERQKWAREALVEVFDTFLGTSFDTGAACRRLARARLADAPAEELADLARTIRELHGTQTMCLTRIRLLANRTAVEAAVRLHSADHAYVDLAQRTDRQLGADDPGLRMARVARDAFIVAAKRAMGIPVLRPGPSLESSRH
jgi:hypothetical protein